MLITSYPDLAYFVLYLKIITTFLENNICIIVIFQGTKNNGIEILVGAIFELLGQFTMRCMYHFQKDVDNFRIEYKC